MSTKRQRQDAAFAAAFDTAARVASEAAIAVRTAKIVAIERESAFDDSSPITQVSAPFEPEGGGNVRVPGNSAFGRWLVRVSGAGASDNGYGRYGSAASFGYGWDGTYRPFQVSKGSSYSPGVRIVTPGRGYQRSATWAAAFAASINASGVIPAGTAWSESYQD